jgi:hypothetical protein
VSRRPTLEGGATRPARICFEKAEEYAKGAKVGNLNPAARS